MKAIELLEARLAEALQALDAAAGFVRNAEEVDTNQNLRRLGHAINSAWEVREEVYGTCPDLKPNFAEEAEVYHARYEDLSKIAQSAYLAEENNELNKAKTLYQELKEAARHEYFVMVAESGLYRISQAEK